MREAVIDRLELVRLLEREFPQAFHAGAGLEVLEIRYAWSRVRQAFLESHLRPGGTISGVTMMQLADAGMYVAVLASIGWAPLAVTTSLNINFLRRPAPGALDAECRLLKVGKRLAVGEVAIASAGDVVAHATSTYSIPPR